ncbi:MAG: aminomethyl transferase family protein, partial [Candidatus Wallbacteria bacterium]|nr:aminomethyl transferase family protein [Candidatus Wallbacteria bacterium]
MRSPLHDLEHQLAARFAEEGGCEVPSSYQDPEGEYRAVRTDCGMADRCHRGKVSVEGPDAREFLHGFVTNDIKGLAEDAACYAAILNLKGKMVADARVLGVDGKLLLDLEPGLAGAVAQHLDKYAIGVKVELKDVSEELGSIGLYGPEAPRVLGTFLGEEVGPLPETQVLDCAFDGEPLWIAGSDLAGEDGYDLIAARALMPALWGALLAAGTGLRPVGTAALEILRVEAGVPRYGRDMDENTIPLEAGLDHAISYTKGCYLGQEVIARISHQGHVNRKLTGFVLDRGVRPAPGTKLLAADRETGWLTTVVDSPALGRPVALGLARREYLEPGTRLTLDGGLGEAVVHALPFYRSGRR